MAEISDPSSRITEAQAHLQSATEILVVEQAIPAHVRAVLANILLAHNLLASCVKELVNTNSLPDITDTLARQGRILFNEIDWTYHKEAKDEQRCTQLLRQLFTSHGENEFSAVHLRKAMRTLGFFESNSRGILTGWVSTPMIETGLLERKNKKLRLSDSVLAAAQSSRDTPP